MTFCYFSFCLLVLAWKCNNSYLESLAKGSSHKYYIRCMFPYLLTTWRSVCAVRCTMDWQNISVRYSVYLVCCQLFQMTDWHPKRAWIDCIHVHSCFSTVLIIHHLIQYCLTTGPYYLPKQDRHIVRSSASSFSSQYPLVALMSSSSLCLLPRLLFTYILPYIFLSIRCVRRQSLRKIWPIQVAFLPFVVCRIFLSSLTLCITSSLLTRSFQLIFSILLQYHISKLSRYFWSTFRSVQVQAPYKAMLQM